MALPNPVILVPGITATYLRDQYALPPEDVWTVLRKDFLRSVFHPDSLADTKSYEALEPARVVPDQIYEIAYKELIEQLRYELSPSEDKPVPVYPFGYDWRQPLDDIETQFDTFVEEVIERTKLMRHYHPAFGVAPKVNVVGHSMGGLIIAGYLQRAGAKRRIGKVVTLASPFQGSFEAVIKVITGTANLGTEPPSSREREAARMTPSLYHLVPSFKGSLVEEPQETPRDLFDPANWQSSVITSIATFIRERGLEAGVAEPIARERAARLFSAMLRRAKEHRARIDGLRLADAQLSGRDWLCIIGVNSETRVALRMRRVGDAPDFVLRTKDRADEWDTKTAPASQRRRTGDGTVPFDGAIPRFLPYESLVCVSPDDFGYWGEAADRLLAKVAGFHGILPKMDMVHRLIVRHFTGREDAHGNTWGRLPPGVAKDQWTPPVPGLEPKD